MATPKLRFKEFGGDWTLSILADISNIITGSTPATSKSEYYDGDFLFVSPVDIQENRYVDKTKTTLSKEGFSKCRHIAKNSILFVCIGSTIGKIAQNKEICATNQQINAVIPKDGYASDFLYLVLDKLAPSIKLNAGVQAVPLINKTEFGKTELIIPALDEQTKIASFLSAVDEKISQLTQKHELLSQYKQGMMQKLFSQQIRFKADDGSEFGEWEYKELGLLLDYEQPTKYIVSSTNYDNSFPIPVLTAGKTFILGYTNEEHGIFSAESQNVIIFDDFTTAYKFVNFNFKVKSSAMKILKTDPRKNNIFYLYSTFSTLFLSLGDEHKRRWISEYSKLEVPVPCLKEQTKIANFLSAIDQKIEVVGQQIEQAKQWKKGLLQQMFI